jgi:hypothetical protein
MTSLNARIILAVSPLKQQPCNHNDDGSANLYYLKKIMFRSQQYVKPFVQPPASRKKEASINASHRRIFRHFPSLSSTMLHLRKLYYGKVLRGEVEQPGWCKSFTSRDFRNRKSTIITHVCP